MLSSLLTIISRIFWRFSNKRWCNSIDVDLILWNSESKGLTVEGFFKWKSIWNNVKRFQSILFGITHRQISSALRKILKNSRLTVTVRAGSRLPKSSRMGITAEMSKIIQTRIFWCYKNVRTKIFWRKFHRKWTGKWPEMTLFRPRIEFLGTWNTP